MRSPFHRLPPLLFGDAGSLVQRNFQALADQFSHVVPNCDYDSSAKDNFLYKGNVFAMPGLVFNHAINSHLIAHTELTHYSFSLALGGQHHVAEVGSPFIEYQALFTPPNTRLHFDNGLERLSSALHIIFDLERLNRVSLAMQGGEGVPMMQTHLRTVKLRYGPINLRQLFIQLTGQIDAFAGNVALLQAAGFDDQVYRLLAITLQPEIFLKDYLSPQEQRQCKDLQALCIFERHVEAHLQEPLRMTEIELRLGVSARALQYACMKKHGCSPATYIRNQRLDYAYRQLLQDRDGTKLADLAAQLHFSSQSQFARYFRERFGVLPSEVIRSNRTVRPSVRAEG